MHTATDNDNKQNNHELETTSCLKNMPILTNPPKEQA
jgi:hypothetical protein